MNRRAFITLIGGAAAWPLVARGQQPSMPVIGFLSSGSPDLSAREVAAFWKGLNETGHSEGRNVAIEYRWAGDENERLPILATDLVRRQVTVIAAPNNAAALAAKSATTRIPIVFAVSVDPVGFGLVNSLNRPEGNVTGVTTLNMELGPKRLELLREVVPTATTIALLVNPSNPAAETDRRKAHEAARTFGLQLHVLHATTEHDFASAFAKVIQLRAGAVMIAADRFFNTRSPQLAVLALSHGVAAIYQYRDFAAAGGLMSYGGSLTDSYHRAGVYTGRILKGENLIDLPVQQYAKVELIVNLKTAKALGLEIPPTLLARADEVIE
jgi:ABC-type uncharacterized transport system substrate-binding protein